MFAYGASLVELGIVSEVHINFLIVGHTHSNLDQYFSVYSKKIKRCEFIGSVLAMHELYRTAHSGKFVHLRPRSHDYEKLLFVHDWVSYFAPIINTRLKWYKVPHRFKVFALYGRAVCQYSVFTPLDRSEPKWMPLLPLRTPAFTPDRDDAVDVILTPLVVVDNGTLITNEMSIGADSSGTNRRTLNAAHRNARNLNAFHDMHEEIERLELDALSSMIHNLDRQREGDEDETVAPKYVLIHFIIVVIPKTCFMSKCTKYKCGFSCRSFI